MVFINCGVDVSLADKILENISDLSCGELSAEVAEDVLEFDAIL